MLKYNEKDKSFDISQGDYAELAQFIQDADEVIYDPAIGRWEIDGVLFSDEWISNQVIQLSHFINVIAHMHLRKGVLAPKDKITERLLDIKNGKVPGRPS